MIDGPYSVGPFETIVNVHFGSVDVIVVFTGMTPSAGGGLTVIADEATLLSTEPSSFGLMCWFVHVRADLARTFVTTKLDFSPGQQGVGFPFVVAYVCPVLKGDVATSLARARVVVANALTAGFGSTPPGILLNTQFRGLPGAVLPWRITYVNHLRNMQNPSKMVQCFPLSVSPNTFFATGFLGEVEFTFTYRGFNIVGYRLDETATGTLYGVKYPVPGGNASGGAGAPGVPSEWGGDRIESVVSNVSPDESFDYGVFFPGGAQLPLISADVRLP